MKVFFLSLMILTPVVGFAQEDVCCIMEAVNGNNVTTSGDFKSKTQCEEDTPTTTHTGTKNVCTALPADDDACTDGGSKAQEQRCSLCGKQWVKGACIVEDLEKEVERLKKEKAELEKKTATGQK